MSGAPVSRGRPVFLRAEARPFVGLLWFSERAGNRVSEKPSCRGLTLRRLIITRGNLSTNTTKITKCLLLAGMGPMLRSSACLNAGFVRMWAQHSAFLALSDYGDPKTAVQHRLECS